MKIEKGKLYYNGECVKKAIDDMYFDRNDNVTNKIAVYCPFKEDIDCISNILGDVNHNRLYVFINEGYGMCRDHNDYHLITIDQFKEFYPESVISNKTEENVQNNDPINPTHYNQCAIQPLDYIEANGFDFCEGNVIKYVSRYKQKNGLEDLKKARVYLDKLINRYEK